MHLPGFYVVHGQAAVLQPHAQQAGAAPGPGQRGHAGCHGQRPQRAARVAQAPEAQQAALRRPPPVLPMADRQDARVCLLRRPCKN